MAVAPVGVEQHQHVGGKAYGSNAQVVCVVHLGFDLEQGLVERDSPHQRNLAVLVGAQRLGQPLLQQRLRSQAVVGADVGPLREPVYALVGNVVQLMAQLLRQGCGLHPEAMAKEIAHAHVDVAYMHPPVSGVEGQETRGQKRLWDQRQHAIPLVHPESAHPELAPGWEGFGSSHTVQCGTGILKYWVVW